jgi:5-methyltetrahydrofolate--homocysteine methyltransferase
MSIVGEKYSSGEFFLPQMMIAAKAMSECMQHIGARLIQSGYERKGKAVLGTVAGDFHDIGKNIVKLMLEGNGWEVVDLGVDVGPEAFVDAIRREAPQFVLMSALITLTMDSMRRTVEAMEAAGVRTGVRVGVGGAPVTQKFAEEIRADFYGADAYACVEHCNRLMPEAGVHR